MLIVLKRGFQSSKEVAIGAFQGDLTVLGGSSLQALVVSKISVLLSNLGVVLDEFLSDGAIIILSRIVLILLLPGHLDVSFLEVNSELVLVSSPVLAKVGHCPYY